jgi:hypothetical protein
MYEDTKSAEHNLRELTKDETIHIGGGRVSPRGIPLPSGAIAGVGYGWQPGSKPGDLYIDGFNVSF